VEETVVVPSLVKLDVSVIKADKVSMLEVATVVAEE
jgi:hypothetical protein